MRSGEGWGLGSPHACRMLTSRRRSWRTTHFSRSSSRPYDVYVLFWDIRCWLYRMLYLLLETSHTFYEEVCIRCMLLSYTKVMYIFAGINNWRWWWRYSSRSTEAWMRGICVYVWNWWNGYWSVEEISSTYVGRFWQSQVEALYRWWIRISEGWTFFLIDFFSNLFIVQFSTDGISNPAIKILEFSKRFYSSSHLCCCLYGQGLKNWYLVSYGLLLIY